MKKTIRVFVAGCKTPTNIEIDETTTAKDIPTAVGLVHDLCLVIQAGWPPFWPDEMVLRLIHERAAVFVSPRYDGWSIEQCRRADRTTTV